MCFAPVVHRRRGVARRCGDDTWIDRVSDGTGAAESAGSERQISGQAERKPAVQQLSAVRSGQRAHGNGHVQGRRRTDQPERLLHYLGCEAVAEKLAHYVHTRDSASLSGRLSRWAMSRFVCAFVRISSYFSTLMPSFSTACTISCNAAVSSCCSSSGVLAACSFGM